MKFRIFLPVLIGLLCLTLVSTARAATPLELCMKQIGKAYKQLALDLKQPSDAGKADYLALATTMQTQAQKARDLVPKKAASLPPDQQAAMVKDYQKSMDELVQTIGQLSQDLQGNKWADATKVMADLKQQMMDGHKAFRTKDKAG